MSENVTWEQRWYGGTLLSCIEYQDEYTDVWVPNRVKGKEENRNCVHTGQHLHQHLTMYTVYNLCIGMLYM